MYVCVWGGGGLNSHVSCEASMKHDIQVAVNSEECFHH